MSNPNAPGQLAEAMLEAKRAPDIVGRLGGEEFAILLPETRAAEAAFQAERLRLAVQALRVADGEGAFRFTCSFGVSELAGADTLDTLIGRADAALYRAKAEGRNRVIPRFGYDMEHEKHPT